MDPAELDLIPDHRRDILEKWLAYCRGADVDEGEFEAFIHTEATDEELRVFFSPFDCADELLARLKTTHRLRPEPAGEDVLVSALKDYVAEMARNADVIGEPEMAEHLRSITTFRRVQNVSDEARDNNVVYLNMSYQDAVGDAVSDDIFSSTPLVRSLFSVTDRWFGMPFLQEYFLQPLFTSDLDFTAYFRMLSVGGLDWVKGDEALVSPWFSLDSDEPLPPLILKSRADKEAARAGVDWSELPTAAHDVEALRAAAHSGDHPSLAKLSVMYLAGIGVDYDYRIGIDTLEKAAGDYPSVAQCFETAASLDLAAGHFGLYYLTNQGWGFPKSEDAALLHLERAAHGGFAPAMYLYGYRHMDNSRGSNEDYAKAELWLLKAERAGVSGAAHMLYCLYRRKGDINDPAKAFRWLKINANGEGGRVTHMNLAYAYERGTGTDVDPARAYTWMYVAALQNPAKPEYEEKDLDRLAASLTVDEIAEAIDRAHAWIQERGYTLEEFSGSDGRPFINPATRI